MCAIITEKSDMELGFFLNKAISIICYLNNYNSAP